MRLLPLLGLVALLSGCGEPAPAQGDAPGTETAHRATDGAHAFGSRGAHPGGGSVGQGGG